MQRKIIQVEEKVPLLQGLPLSFQHLFAMFGASVLVPMLFNGAAGKTVVDPSLVLLMNGIGTLLYLIICKGKAPAFLGSSFAFLNPTFAVLASTKGDFSQALGGFILSGAIFVIVAIIIGLVGTKWIDIVLPPAAMGPIVALIGLELALGACDNAGLVNHAGTSYNKYAIIISLFTLAVVIIGSLVFRGFLSVIPILIAIVSGYGLAAILDVIYPAQHIMDYSIISGKDLLSFPKTLFPTFNFDSMLVILPAALVVISEHIGHLQVTSKIVGRDLVKDPGLHRSMFSDGISTMLSGFMGSVPTTTYGENMGVMAITKVYSVWVIGGAAVISIILAFFGKLGGVIQSIPGPVMGGISMFLFGVIAASGIRILVEAKVDYSKAKNLILTAVVFVVGIAGVNDPATAPSLCIKLGKTSLKGMVLATIVGIVLSIFFYVLEKLKLTNDQEA